MNCFSPRVRDETTRRSERGFTLIELLVVLVILALLAGLVGPRVIGYVGSSNTKAAQLQIENLKSALDLYLLDNGNYPTTEQGLAALVRNPGITSWGGPYLSDANVPKDPWGNPYIYRSPGEHGRFDVLSYGSDGREGGEGEAADGTSW